MRCTAFTVLPLAEILLIVYYYYEFYCLKMILNRILQYLVMSSFRKNHKTSSIRIEDNDYTHYII